MIAHLDYCPEISSLIRSLCSFLLMAIPIDLRFNSKVAKDFPLVIPIALVIVLVIGLCLLLF